MTEHPYLDPVQIDTTDPAGIQRAAEQVVTAHPDLNVLVARAGVMQVEDCHSNTQPVRKPARDSLDACPDVG